MQDNQVLDLFQHDNFRKIRQYTIVLFVLFGVLAFITLISKLFFFSLTGIYVPIIRFVLVILSLVFVFRGKQWAGALLTFMIAWGLVVLIFGVIRYISFDAPLIYFVLNGIYLVVYILTFRLLNFNKHFQDFYKHQKQKYQKLPSRLI